MAEITVVSELNGAIFRIVVAEGDSVARDQELIILECMKTEIPVASPAAGRVRSILLAEGDLVSERQPLLVLETG